MASINIRNELFGQSESSNKECLSYVINKTRPITSGIVSNSLSGDIIFDFTTGASEWLDLFNTHLVYKFETNTLVDFLEMDNYGQCLFDRGQLFFNGVMVSSSNNWTQDSILNKRLQFGADYNKTLNGFGYINDAADQAAATANTYPAGSYTVTEFLDALFMRSPDVIIPPNTNIRLILTTAATNGINKSGRGDGVNSAMVIVAKELYLNTFLVVKSDPVPDNVKLSLITTDSFKSSITSASLDVQHMSKPNLVRLSAFFIDVKAFGTDLTSADKLFSQCNFRWDTDNSYATTTDKLNTLYFKAGQHQLPNEAFDATTYGLLEMYNQYNVLSNKTLDPSGNETPTEWAQMGPILTVKVVKPIGDTSKNIEVHGTFAATPTAYAYLVAHNEQIVEFIYQNGVPLQTNKSF